MIGLNTIPVTSLQIVCIFHTLHSFQTLHSFPFASLDFIPLYIVLIINILGNEPKQVEFADIGCGYGGLIGKYK